MAGSKERQAYVRVRVRDTRSRARSARLAAPFLALLAAVFVAAPAHAAKGPLLGHAEPQLLTDDTAKRSLLFDESVNAGVDVVRLDAYWFRVQPDEPAVLGDGRDPDDASYDWDRLDAAVRAADARGLDVILTMHRAPEWAVGPGAPPTGEHVGRGSWKPDVGAFGDYIHAIATRYSGSYDPDGPGPGTVLPEVDQYQLWNECNLAKFLAPQFESGQPVAHHLCRQLVNEGYAELEAVDPSATAIFPGTAPVGPTNDERLEPEEFLRLAFCLNKKLKPALGSCGGAYTFDVYDHHPIAVNQAPSKPGKNGNVLIADYDKVSKIVRAAEKHDTIEPIGGAAEPRPLWATEIYWETDPPETKRGFPEKTVAAFLAEGIHLLAEHDVELILNFFMIDAVMTTPGSVTNIQGGLLFPDFERKLSFDAFRFPLVGNTKGKKKVAVWGVAPAGGKVAIQVPKGKRGWKTVAKVSAADGDVVQRTIKLAKPKKPKLKGLSKQARKKAKKKYKKAKAAYKVRAVSGGIKSVPYSVK